MYVMALAKLLEILSPTNRTPTDNIALLCWSERSQNCNC